MKKLVFAIAITILTMPLFHPIIHAQDGGFGGGEGIDVTGLLGDRGGRGGQG